MKFNKVLNYVGVLGDFASKNSPAILTGLAIVGVVTTAYYAYKSGLKADKILKEHRRDMKDCDQKDKEAKKAVRVETAKKMIPVMAPTVLMGGLTIACMFSSHSISTRRLATLSAAYSLSETTIKNLNGKMEEMLGEKKTRAIKDAIMKDKLKATAKEDKKILSDGQVIIPSDGTVLCKDLFSGRFFYSTAEKINQAVSKCQFEVYSDMWVSLNDFYDAINSPQLERLPMGDDLGWGVDDTDRGKLPIRLTALLTDDGKPCLCMDYELNVTGRYV